MNRTEVREKRNELLHVNPDAPLRYFEPLVVDGVTRKASQDRFGNRVFTSSTRAYLDRGRNENNAAILISREGKDFIDRHPGILSDIERGAFELTFTLQPDSQDQIITKKDLGRGRKMSKLSKEGDEGQSSVYLLEVDSEKYIIKKKAPPSSNSWAIDTSQPYINEMLQTQQLGTDLHELLDSGDIELSTFMFATGQISCTRFEEGREPTQEEFRERMGKIWLTVHKYVDSLQPLSRLHARYQPPDLWDHIRLDIVGSSVTDDEGGFEGDTTWRTDNFILRPDKKLVWIDPFLYYPPFI